MRLTGTEADYAISEAYMKRENDNLHVSPYLQRAMVARSYAEYLKLTKED